MATILSNTEVIAELGLPADIGTQLRTAQGNDFEPVANTFLSALVNKICYQRVEGFAFSNPFKKYDGFRIDYGETIENIYVDTILGYKFSDGKTSEEGYDSPFKRAPNNVKSAYVSINYEMQYEVTIEYAVLKRAVLNEYGFASLADAIIQSMVQRRSVDEYMATIIMLNNSDIYANGFEELDVSGLSTDAEKWGAVAKKMVSVVNDMALPSVDNNAAGVLQVTPKERCLMVVKQSVLDSINMDFLAGVFNMSKIDLIKKIIPVRSFMAVVNTANGDDLTPGTLGDDIDFVIVDEKGFDNHVALQDGGNIHNIRNKYVNHYDNLWKIISFRKDFQARAFKLKLTAGTSAQVGE